MRNIYKVVIKAEDYPYSQPKVITLQKGDTVFISDKYEGKVGDKYKNYPAIVSHIYYTPRKWYQFWKKKEPFGIQVTWIEDECGRPDSAVG